MIQLEDTDVNELEKLINGGTLVSSSFTFEPLNGPSNGSLEGRRHSRPTLEDLRREDREATATYQATLGDGTPQAGQEWITHSTPSGAAICSPE